jgi:apolipoprotein N-acyltransferase
MWLNYLLAAISGVLYILACAPIDQYYLMWVAFIPLFFAVERLPESKRTYKQMFLLGLTSAFFMGATGFYWIIHATQNYGGLPWIAAFVLYLAFCFTNQLQVPFFLMFRKKLKDSPGLSGQLVLPAFLLGLAYVGIECLYPKLFADSVGSAFYRASWVRQLADIGGPLFISIFGMAVNELLFQTIRTRKLRGLFVSVVLGIVICAYGYYRNNQFENLKTAHAADPVFRTAMIQANIGDFMKVAAERGEVNATNQVMGQYISLSEKALHAGPAPDAIIWPETAYPAIYGRPFSQNELYMEQMLKGLIANVPGYLIFGGYDNDATKGLDYNSIFFVKPGSDAKQVYHKSVLLMFGETLPFADTFPSMKTWFPTMGFFGRGPGPQVFTLKNALGDSFKFAPSICYEGLFVDHSVDGALQGADALLNVTNDSWFGEDGEPYQHLSLTQFRSIETRLPMIRATNTGFTVWIDPTGNTVKSSELSKAEIVNADVSHRLFPDSPYMAIAKVLGTNWFIRMCQLLTVGMVLFLQFRPKNKGHNSP